MRKPYLKSNWAITVFTAITVTVSQFSVILFTPSLPNLVSDFNTSTGMIQFTIAIFLLMFGVSCLFYGPLSDHYGRRNLIVFALFFMLLGTAIILLSTTIWGFFIGRILQGLGAGGPSVIMRAVLRDRYEAHQMGKVMASRITIIGFAPLIAPLLGGYLQSWFGWRGAFYFLFFYILHMLLLVYLLLPETNVNRRKHEFSFKVVMANYRKVLSHKVYLCFILSILLAYNCQIAYLTIGPFVFQKRLMLTPEEYGQIILLPALCFLLGGILSRFLFRFMKGLYQILIGIILLFVTGVGWMIMIQINFFSIASTIIPLMMAQIVIALVFSNATAGMLKPFPSLSGTAAAFSSFIQMFGNGMLGSLISYLHLTTSKGISTFFIINSLLLFVLFMGIKKFKRSKDYIKIVQ